MQHPQKISGRPLLVLTLFVLTLLAGPVLLSGCSRQASRVDGVLLINGKPANGYEVTFTPVKAGLPARGTTIEEGKFILTRGRLKIDLPVGEYKVTITPIAQERIPAPTLSLPARYTDVDQSTLTKTITPSTKSITIDIET
ncbi:hypothetical protein [Planctomicrobium sp. SH664]|uniref:hypothetical protein n=1 Tax=Planctomicrobium sp. SH664 TaxID=3448125 RepID=UPI003F5B14D6